MPKSLSLHIIAKNEAKNLPELFASFEGCFDKVYLTDTGSTDDTVKIAESLGAVVSHFAWINDFAAARNFNFEQGDSDFQMWLDCDDSLQNPEAFRLWKSTIMDLADFHYATYHYANDGKNPTCSFMRERVIRRGMGFKWNYFLHEGIDPNSTVRIPRLDLASQWAVWHRRTEEDIKADRMRNLSIFKGREMHMDPRMTFYYGKELLEGGFPEMARHWLTKAIESRDLQAHDKTLALQYQGYALIMIANQQIEFLKTYKDKKYEAAANDCLKQAISVAHEGLKHDPTRAEFHSTLGDCYVKLNGLSQALPFYAAATRCKPGQGVAAGAVFSTADLYGPYPRKAMIEILANTGDIAGANRVALELVEHHPSTEATGILEKINGLQAMSKKPENTEDVSDIIITCQSAGFFAWDGKTYRESFCGGSETAAVEMAENLARITKRKVIVFQPRSEEVELYGVIYKPSEKLPDYLQKFKPYVHIAWRHNIKLTDAFTILWCHDLVTPGAENHENYDFIACLTPFHKRYVMARQGIPDAKIWVTRNGLNPDKFEGMDKIEKDPSRFVFSSSPDRGLDRAMLVLDKVREEFPRV